MTGIVLNGRAETLEDGLTVAALLERLGIDGKIAVEINREILPRQRFSRCTINDGDVIEIVHAIGGG